MRHNVRVLGGSSGIKAVIKAATRAALGRHSTEPLSLNVVLMNNASIRQANRKFLKHDRATDVLAFRYPRPLAGIDGEVLVSVEEARFQARRRRILFRHELLRYAVHGTLHLLGYRDDRVRSKRRMTAAEDDILAELGFSG